MTENGTEQVSSADQLPEIGQDEIALHLGYKEIAILQLKKRVGQLQDILESQQAELKKYRQAGDGSKEVKT